MGSSASKRDTTGANQETSSESSSTESIVDPNQQTRPDNTFVKYNVPKLDFISEIVSHDLSTIIQPRSSSVNTKGNTDSWGTVTSRLTRARSVQRDFKVKSQNVPVLRARSEQPQAKKSKPSRSSNKSPIKATSVSTRSKTPVPTKMNLKRASSEQPSSPAKKLKLVQSTKSKAKSSMPQKSIRSRAQSEQPEKKAKRNPSTPKTTTKIAYESKTTASTRYSRAKSEQPVTKPKSSKPKTISAQRQPQKSELATKTLSQSTRKSVARTTIKSEQPQIFVKKTKLEASASMSRKPSKIGLKQSTASTAKKTVVRKSEVKTNKQVEARKGSLRRTPLQVKKTSLVAKCHSIGKEMHEMKGIHDMVLDSEEPGRRGVSSTSLNDVGPCCVVLDADVVDHYLYRQSLNKSLSSPNKHTPGPSPKKVNKTAGNITTKSRNKTAKEATSVAINAKPCTNKQTIKTKQVHPVKSHDKQSKQIEISATNKNPISTKVNPRGRLNKQMGVSVTSQGSLVSTVKPSSRPPKQAEAATKKRSAIVAKAGKPPQTKTHGGGNKKKAAPGSPHVPENGPVRMTTRKSIRNKN